MEDLIPRDIAAVRALIEEFPEENLRLEYKLPHALVHKKDKPPPPIGGAPTINREAVKSSMAKVVASLANADGGLILYGVADAKHGAIGGAAGRILPVLFSDIDPDSIHQILRQKISPPLDVTVTKVPLEDAADRGVVVLSVPRGLTAHMVEFRYPRRGGEGKEYMEHFEVEDVKNRLKHPRLTVTFVGKLASRGGMLLGIAIKNESQVFARFYHIAVWINLAVFWNEEQRAEFRKSLYASCYRADIFRFLIEQEVTIPLKGLLYGEYLRFETSADMLGVICPGMEHVFWGSAPDPLANIGGDYPRFGWRIHCGAVPVEDVQNEVEARL